MSETCMSVSDLYVCQASSHHIMCVIILICWLLGPSPGVLAHGPASDKSSSVTHSLPQTTCTNHIIQFPKVASACVCVWEPTSNKPSPQQHWTSNLGEKRPAIMQSL